jgi:DNA modification methylase
VKTLHTTLIGDAGDMTDVFSESVDLVVTSPPYPMIRMWDDLFSRQNPSIRRHLDDAAGMTAFELMHLELDRVWDEILRVLKPGGFACINIGDATRKLGDDFCLYPNHARVLQHLTSMGWQVLPDILWRKQTNAPNKFMGSGMLPAGAYVTLEHEYILVARKGSKRRFASIEEKNLRRESALFWEERNQFFSDVWTDLKGTGQELKQRESRNRSAAFPFELAYRLICMYSVKQDVILDPFLGTGTTQMAAAAACRNSIGVEMDASLVTVIEKWPQDIVDFANPYHERRLARHMDFVNDRLAGNKPLKYRNRYYGFPVMTSQETDLYIHKLEKSLRIEEESVQVHYLSRSSPVELSQMEDSRFRGFKGSSEMSKGHKQLTFK